MRDDWVTKLAYTGAEAFVATALTSDFDWLRQRLGDVLGPRFPQHLAQSRDRLDGASRVIEAEAESAEIEAWGERLCAALHDRPDLAIRLRSIVDEAGVRLLLAPPLPSTRGLG